MEWIAEITHPRPRQFKIIKELLTSLTIGVPDRYSYYFFVYENGLDTHDYLQDTLEIAMEQAFEQFDVPYEAWRKVK
jgi:hypothetical protein